ncbi:TonB-dependent receptor plug domain-containing protein [Novosphingobium colocasiae]
MPNALCLGPDGWLYFPLVPLGEVWRVPVEGGAAQRVVGGLDIPTAVKFDPAGRLVVVRSGSGAVTRVDIGTGSASLFAQVAYGIDNLAFAPDGRLFVSHFTDGEVIEIAPDGTRRVAVAGGLSGPYGLCAGADGTVRVADGMSIAAVATDGTVDRPAMLLQHGFPGYVRGWPKVPRGRGSSRTVPASAAATGPAARRKCWPISLDEAMGVLRHGDDIYLCEAGAGRVLGIDSAGAVRVVAGGLERPTGIAVANDGGLLVTEAAGGRLLHLSACGEAATVMNGMSEPHGVACTRGSIFVIDRATASLHCVDPHGVASVIAEDLPTGPGKRHSSQCVAGDSRPDARPAAAVRRSVRDAVRIADCRCRHQWFVAVDQSCVKPLDLLSVLRSKQMIVCQWWSVKPPVNMRGENSMKTRTHLFRCALAASAACGAIGFADVALAEAATDSGDIIVTARRAEERLQDVPVAVTAISAKALSEQHITSETSLQQATPGLTVRATSSSNQLNYSIRGQSIDLVLLFGTGGAALFQRSSD